MYVHVLTFPLPLYRLRLFGLNLNLISPQSPSLPPSPPADSLGSNSLADRLNHHFAVLRKEKLNTLGYISDQMIFKAEINHLSASTKVNPHPPSLS